VVRRRRISSQRSIGLVAGPEKKRVMSTKEREIVAYHESGNAIVASCCRTRPGAQDLDRPARFGALGYSEQLPLEDGI